MNLNFVLFTVSSRTISSILLCIFSFISFFHLDLIFFEVVSISISMSYSFAIVSSSVYQQLGSRQCSDRRDAPWPLVTLNFPLPQMSDWQKFVDLAFGMVHQGRACHTEDDGPTFVRKPIVHEKNFYHLCPKEWSFLMTNLLCYFSSIWWTIWSLAMFVPKPIVLANYHFSKVSGTHSHDSTSVPKPVFLAC